MANIDVEKEKTTIIVAASQTSQNDEEFKRDWRFWAVFLSLSCCTLLSALDLGGIGTAAPSIVHQLHGSEFTWVASAYALSSSAFMPLSGNLAQIFGRRVIMIGGIISFAVGSAISGSAHSLAILILGRAIQGVGAGVMQTTSSIVITDLVPLRFRGIYAGITGVIWTTGSSTGPFIAGGLAERATWRWLFYLNLPLSGISLVVVCIFLRVKNPEGSIGEKLLRVDWLGNILLMASSSLCMIALTFGGVRFPWTSKEVLAPLLIGLSGILATLLYDARYAQYPVIPIKALSNRTSFSGYVATFVQGLITLGIGFYLPTWFQSVKVASPITSGLYFLPLAATISPSAIIQGVIVAKTGSYRSVNLLGWVLSCLGIGLLISMRIGTNIGLIVLYQLIIGVGLGFLYAIIFPILAPLPLSENGPAVAFLTFLRQFSQAWGVAIGGTILQNRLRSKLPDTISSFGLNRDGQVAYDLVPLIPSIPQPLQQQVREAFVDSFKPVWVSFAICSAAGMLCLVPMKDYPLKKMVDGRWAIDKDKKQALQTQSVVQSDLNRA